MSYLKRQYRHLVEDPSYFWMKALARFELARDVARRTSAKSDPNTPSAVAPPPRITVDHGTEGALSLLEREGYYVGLRLTQEVLTGLLRQIELATCYGDGELDLPFRADQRAQTEAHYQRGFQRGSYLHQHESWPEFQALREDACLAAIATHYLGCCPVYLRSEIAWTYPRPFDGVQHSTTPSRFECDIQGFRSLTLTFYLTDVGAGDGPHTYIKKNPRQRPLTHQLLGRHCAELSEQRLAQTYGSEQMVTVYGPRGLGFMGDPYYLHRSGIPTQREHLLLQIELGSKRYRTEFH